MISKNKKNDSKKHLKTKKNRTIKKYKNEIHGRIISIKEGWKTMYIFGNAYQRGFAHGYLLKDELVKNKKVLLFLLKHDMKISYSEFIKVSNSKIKPNLIKNYPEFYEEIVGISKGAKYAGIDISVDWLIMWNSYMSLYSYFKDGSIIRCSAFIATGNATEKGDIIMAHNTHTNFADGQLHNINMYVYPSSGYSFVMQTSAGYIASGTDWFICSSGIIGNETTISSINYKPVFGDPYFCRIRKAMQYGNSLDEYASIMETNNAGDYACSWQFGNVHTNEIMLFEMTLKEKNIQKTKNGVFYGMNSAMGENIRKKETTDVDHLNISTSVGARNHRLNYLLNKKYYGKINIHNAKEIMADHYDPYLEKDVMGVRGICKHMELSPEHTNRPPYMLFGCTDAKVVNTNMAMKLSYCGRFGPACGSSFSIKKHIRMHPEYKDWEDVVDDFKSYKWTTIEL